MQRAPVLIRFARSDIAARDAAAVAALLGDLDALHARLQPGFFRASRDADRAVDRVRGLASAPESRLFIAETAGAIVGALYLRLYDTPRADELRPRRRAHIETLAVAPGRRRRGVGRRLVEEAEAWARSRDAEQVVLTVWEGNAAAESFYRALGYGPASRVLHRELK